MQNEMLIVDDLMLLLIDDKSGTIAGEGTLYYTLCGAVLVELALRGLVETDETRTIFNGLEVRAVEGEPPSDPLLRSAYDRIAERPRGVQTLLIEIGTHLRGQVIDRLVERGLIRRERERMLGLFRTTRFRAENPQYEAEMLERVRAVLEDGADPDSRTAALAALLSASGTLPTFHPAIKWSGKVYKRAKELESGSWGADAVNTAVVRTAAAIAAASTVAVTTAVQSGG
ncbi:GOLPH3/VPS74 family protein [Polymorphospora rubra]|uniref:GPP34 family phosphoprotein n=1 Tax=Polymorphospora rubra TaxID=338584 RepID=A0A810N958_9ACTN|nr:GPP34 family phosphoprotein [Polymorphospora rubra]BCJ68338.1 hypothetical protein Prubr_53590 [Polymorphospora rubra]